MRVYEKAHWTCVLGYPHILIYEFLKIGYPMLVVKRVFINKEEKIRYFKRLFPIGRKNKNKGFLNALFEGKLGIPEIAIKVNK